MSLGAFEALVCTLLLFLQLRQMPAALVQLDSHTVLLFLQLLDGGRNMERSESKKMMTETIEDMKTKRQKKDGKKSKEKK